MRNIIMKKACNNINGVLSLHRHRFSKLTFYLSAQHQQEISTHTSKIKYDESGNRVHKKETFAFKLDSDVEKAIINKEVKEKQHPGLMNLKLISSPDQLQEAAYQVFKEYTHGDIIHSSFRLWNVLKHRQVPVEENIKKKKKSEIESRLEKKSPIKPYLDLLNEEDRTEITKERDKKAYLIHRKSTYNWKPLTYNSFRSVQYLARRFAPEYAGLVRIFHEIKTRVPDFQPRSLYDFGSGVGTGIWAVDHVWPGVCRETLSFDPSDEMNTLNDRLLRGGNSIAKLRKREGGTSFKNYMQYSDKVPYDLVISAYSLFEVGFIDSRVKALDILWRKVAPGGMLVLVEQGTKNGYEIIIQAREYLLHCIKQEVEDGFEGGHILAPCPHEQFCPRYFTARTACSFDIKYYELKIAEEDNQKQNKESMSFVVFRRGTKGPVQEKYNWHRILRGKTKRSGHILIPTCNPNGELTEYCVTKKRHGTICYSVCRHSEKGDLLPIEILPYEGSSEDTDIKSEDVDPED